MSQDYIYNLSHGFERPSQDQLNQIRRDKMRVQGFEGSLEAEGTAVYGGGGGMLSEMFNFPPATELLENQMMNYQQQQQHNRNQRDWYGNTAQAMQLFLMNPSSHQDESPSSQSSSHPQHHNSSSTLNMLPNTVLHHQQSLGSTSAGSGQGQYGPSTQFTWVPPGAGTSHVDTTTTTHGLSLSLSSSTLQQHLEVGAKVEDLRIGDDPTTAMLYFNQDSYRNLQLQGGIMGPIHVGYGSSSLGVVKALRTSRYVKAAQELLEEFCSVGRGHFKVNKSGSKHNPNQNPSNSGGSTSSKDLPPLSSAERIEHQRRKTKLLSMLDEVDRRYNHYCEQMQMVVNSFDLVLGFGAAVPYTSLAQKAMSRHFRCLKDAISAQLKHSCELLGEKDVGASGVTKGETPRLKMLEQSLRQQRAFHQMGMMEPEAWRPQRGLPERSVNILRAWLFEHFLHPYPSDADKHLLARQTGLSRNQVSNWFINARVRLWKPMVEDMYQQESKEEEGENQNHSTRHKDDQHQDQDHDDENTDDNDNDNDEQQIQRIENTRYDHNQTVIAPPASPPTTAPTYTATTTHAKRFEINEAEKDPSLLAINTQNCFSENQAMMSYSYSGGITAVATPPPFDADTSRRGSMFGADQYRTTTTGDDDDHATPDIGSTLIRFGTTSGDVSLTLGLRHAGGNLPADKTSFFS